MDFKEKNERYLNYLSDHLNNHEKAIASNDVYRITKMGVSVIQAYSYLFAAHLNLDIYESSEDRLFFSDYILPSLHEENKMEYMDNPYYKNIHFPKARKNDWEFRMDRYAPFEAFVRDDFVYEEEKVIPQIGFFASPFYFPAVYQNNRLWMSVTPNEINTMKEPLAHAHGHALTYGLGLGYFTYMAALKDDVSDITVVEKDASVISLFRQYILPQFPHPEKVRIIQEDALVFAEKIKDNCTYDTVFADLWHDVSDGLVLYKKLKALESRKNPVIYDYWIEKTMIYYL